MARPCPGHVSEARDQGVADRTLLVLEELVQSVLYVHMYAQLGTACAVMRSERIYVRGRRDKQ